MAQPVVHWEIGGSNPAKSREFYAKLFDWKIQVMEAMDYGMVEASGEKSIGGGIGPVPPGGKPYVTFYIKVDDLQQYLDKAGELGGTTIMPPMDIPEAGSIAMFADIDGNTIGLFKELA